VRKKSESQPAIALVLRICICRNRMVNRDVPQVERWSYKQLAGFLSWCQGMQANCPSNSETGRQRESQ
jgi:hypothetical protein